MNCPMSALFAALSLLAATAAASATDDRNHKKRQIYREQVLPHAGGRIPETAFETDRLFLNHLQKEGIAVPDGIVLEQRNPQVYPFLAKSSRSVFRIALSSDGRYTAQVGRYRYQSPPSIETTYLYPQIHGQHVQLQQPSTAAPTPHQPSLPSPPPALPVYRQFQLHNPLLNQLSLQPKKKAHNLNVTPTHGRVGGKGRFKAFKSESYQNFNLLNMPLAGLASGARKSTSPRGYSSLSGSSGDTKHHHYLPNYGTSAHLFNQFDGLFVDFNLHESSGGGVNGSGDVSAGGSGSGSSSIGRSFPNQHSTY